MKVVICCYFILSHLRNHSMPDAAGIQNNIHSTRELGTDLHRTSFGYYSTAVDESRNSFQCREVYPLHTRCGLLDLPRVY